MPQAERCRSALIILETLIANCYEAQEETTITPLSPLSWLNEYCQVKMYLPRQSGHTSAILSVFQRDPENTLVIAPRENMRQHMVSYFEICDHLDHIKTVHDYSSAGLDFRLVLVDCASFLSKRKVEEIKQAFTPICRHQPFCIALIQ